MTEPDPKLRPEAQKRLQLLELAAQWREQLLYFETPNQTLERERTKAISGWKDAQAKARACVIRDHETLAHFDKALDEAFAFHAELMDLERRCDCAEKERQDNYERQYRDLMLKFPFPLEDMSSALLPSTAPNVTTPRLEASEVSTAIPDCRVSTASLPLDLIESDLDRPEQFADAREPTPETGFSLETASTPETVANDDTGVEEVPSASRPHTAPVSG